jgi:hypothetical protein
MSHLKKNGKNYETTQTKLLREKLSMNLVSINVSILITWLNPRKFFCGGNQKTGFPPSIWRFWKIFGTSL